MRPRYVIADLCWSDIDASLLGNNAGPILLGLREGVDGVDESEFDGRFVEGCFVCRL